MFDADTGEETSVAKYDTDSCENHDECNAIEMFYVNINGLTENKIKHTDLMNDAGNSQIICFAETHLDFENEPIAINSYIAHHSCCRRNNILGRNVKGVSIFLKENSNIANSRSTVIVSENGNLLIIKFSDSTWKDINDIYLILCYRDNRESKHTDKNFLSRISKYISDYKMKNILMIGDLNGRIGAINDNEFSNLPPRASDDKIVNKFGRELIEFCNDASLVIANGRLEEGKYTYHKLHNDSVHKSVIDYLIVSDSLIERIKAFEIMEPRLYTDHAPFRIKIIINKEKSLRNKKHYSQNKTRRAKPFKWTSDCENQFNFNDFRQNCNKLLQNIKENDLTEHEVYNNLVINHKFKKPKHCLLVHGHACSLK